MASIFSGFLDNLLNPGGNLKDYRHAARLYADSQFRLAPKLAFLYYVNFRLTPSAIQVLNGYSNEWHKELNLLVKEVDLPKYNVDTTTKNQYNRKKNLQTRIDYQPISLSFHDDNLGVTTLLMEAYYKYYYADGRAGLDYPRQYSPRNTYGNETTQTYNYGLDDGPGEPFFESITIYQLARKKSTAFTLVNPLVTQFEHDSMGQADNTKILSNSMQLAYESVIYERDNAEASGFNDLHYDTTPSPVSAAGGGTGSFFGAGGVLDGIGDISNDAANGQVGLGSIITGVNVVRNAGNLSLGGIAREGLGLISNALIKGGSGNPGGIPNVVIPAGGFEDSSSSTKAQPIDSADTGSASSNQSSSSLNSSGIDGIVT